jgi:hypothetical protein
MEFLAMLIRLIHIAFIAWIVYAPFSGIDEWIVLHVIICPFLMLHWVTSSTGCALTILEKRLRGLENDNESFIHQIVAPIYVIDDTTLKTLVFGLTLGLWGVSLSKMSKDRILRTLAMPSAR